MSAQLKWHILAWMWNLLQLQFKPHLQHDFIAIVHLLHQSSKNIKTGT